MERIILHWSAGRNKASSSDIDHYHFIIEGDGTVVNGKHAVSDNEIPITGPYAAHALNCNSGSIGVSLAGMSGAKEFPFDAGSAPINAVQWQTAATLCAQLCQQYGIPVTPTTVLSHAEIYPNLGIKQRGKWDITRLPWNPAIIGHKACGDEFRRLVTTAIGNAGPAVSVRPLLQRGANGPLVREIQTALTRAGFSVAVDGGFGPITERAVKAFQASRGLGQSGVVDSATWDALS